MVWLGRGKDNESEKGRGLFPGCRDRGRFSEAVWKKRKQERGPGVHALRSGGTTLKKKKKRVGLDLESKKFILPCNLVVFIFGII